MKQVIFIVVLFFITVHIYCNDDHSDENNDSNLKFIIFVEPEIIFPKQIFANINFVLCFPVKTNIEMAVCNGPVIGFETNFIPKDYIYGIKAGYYFDLIHFIGLTFRLYSIMYNNNVNQLDIRIQPEIGLAIFGVLGVTYGYNFPLLEMVNNGIGNHRVTLFYKIDLLGYWGNNKWGLKPFS
jgi:hypothetical protein